jgi:protein-arginine kinase activator protein McsA
MGILPIEGYIVVCINCGEEVVFYNNTEYFSSIEIDKQFNDFLLELEEKGWIIDEENNKVLCPKCVKKRENRNVI